MSCSWKCQYLSNHSLDLTREQDASHEAAQFTLSVSLQLPLHERSASELAPELCRSHLRSDRGKQSSCGFRDCHVKRQHCEIVTSLLVAVLELPHSRVQSIERMNVTRNLQEEGFMCSPRTVQDGRIMPFPAKLGLP